MPILFLGMDYLEMYLTGFWLREALLLLCMGLFLSPASDSVGSCNETDIEMSLLKKEVVCHLMPPTRICAISMQPYIAVIQPI